jgi:hypothetical protein
MEEQLKTLNASDGSLSAEVVRLENVFKKKKKKNRATIR